jgi:hypothetical protein
VNALVLFSSRDARQDPRQMSLIASKHLAVGLGIRIVQDSGASACAATVASTTSPSLLCPGSLSLRIDRLKQCSRAATFPRMLHEHAAFGCLQLVARSGSSKDVERAWITLDAISLAKTSQTKIEKLLVKARVAHGVQRCPRATKAYQGVPTRNTAL